MITPSEIQKKANSKYNSFLKAWLIGEEFFPLHIPSRLANSSTPWEELHIWMTKLLDGSVDRKGYGYKVEFRDGIRTRTHGTQSLPARIMIPTETDFLKLIGKLDEFKRFVKSTSLIQTTFEELKYWIHTHPGKIISHHSEWPDLLKVLKWFKAHPRPGLYLRDIPIEVDTKFVETRKGILRELLEQILPPSAINSEGRNFEQMFGLREKPFMVRFRILDPELLRSSHLPADYLALPLESLSNLPFSSCHVIISENEMPFLTLPSLKNGIAIWGEGASVAGIKATWLASCKIWYWGDLDIQGFQFLARFRSLYPQVESLMMDAATLDAHQAYWVEGKEDGKKIPENLTEEELEVYHRLKEGNIRLEQERISWGWRARKSTLLIGKERN